MVVSWCVVTCAQQLSMLCTFCYCFCLSLLVWHLWLAALCRCAGMVVSWCAVTCAQQPNTPQPPAQDRKASKLHRSTLPTCGNPSYLCRCAGMVVSWCAVMCAQQPTTLSAWARTRPTWRPSSTGHVPTTHAHHVAAGQQQQEDCCSGGLTCVAAGISKGAIAAKDGMGVIQNSSVPGSMCATVAQECSCADQHPGVRA